MIGKSKCYMMHLARLQDCKQELQSYNHALPSEPKILKNLAQFWAKTSVASSVASGKGVPASALLSASAYGSRHHELTLICISAVVKIRQGQQGVFTHLGNTLRDHLAPHVFGQLIGAVSTDGHAALELFAQSAEQLHVPLTVRTAERLVRAVSVAYARSENVGTGSACQLCRLS